jgi:magnesium-transporting ATPase (P-type)
MTTGSQPRGVSPKPDEQSRGRPTAVTPKYQPGGLTAGEVEQRQRQYGFNLLPQAQHLAIWRRLLAQLAHFFAVMLWIAGGLAILAGMPQLGSRSSSSSSSTAYSHLCKSIVRRKLATGFAIYFLGASW